MVRVLCQEADNRPNLYKKISTLRFDFDEIQLQVGHFVSKFANNAIEIRMLLPTDSLIMQVKRQSSVLVCHQ